MSKQCDMETLWNIIENDLEKCRFGDKEIKIKKKINTEWEITELRNWIKNVEWSVQSCGKSIWKPYTKQLGIDVTPK